MDPDGGFWYISLSNAAKKITLRKYSFDTLLMI